MSHDVAPSLAAIDPAWLGRILGVPIDSVTVESVAFTGATTHMARLAITYAGRPEPDAALPGSLIAKARGTTEVQTQMDAMIGLFDREARFYASFADQVPVRTPRAYHAGADPAHLILLEDLAGTRMGDQMIGMSLPDAEATIDALATLHAAFWESPQLDASWLARPGTGTIAAIITQLVASGLSKLTEQFAGHGYDDILSHVQERAPHWGEMVLAPGSEGPPTLVHNDVRLDNLFFASGGEPIFIDWQFAACTRGTQDVANLLTGSMDGAELAQHWQALLHRYHDGLVERGVVGYSYQQCEEHYRVNALYPLGAGMALLGAMDIGDGRGLGERICGRCLSHISELDSFGALTPAASRV